MSRLLATLALAGAMVLAVSIHGTAAAKPHTSRINVHTGAAGVPTGTAGPMELRLANTLKTYRESNAKSWACVAQPSGGNGEADVTVDAAVAWEPDRLDGIAGMFGSSSGRFRVTVTVTAPGFKEPLVAEEFVAPAGSDRDTSVALVGKAADLLGNLMGKHTPCKTFEGKGTVKHKRSNPSVTQTQEGKVNVSFAVIRSADDYLALHPATSASAEAETRQYFAEAQAKGEFPIAGTGTIDLTATHTRVEASCPGTSTHTQVPVHVTGTIEGNAVKLQIFATSSVTLMETCFGVRCAAMDYGRICPGGAHDPAQGSSEHQLPLLGTLFAGGDLSFGLDSDGTARLTQTSGEDTVTWELQIEADSEEEPQAVAVALVAGR